MPHTPCGGTKQAGKGRLRPGGLSGPRVGSVGACARAWTRLVLCMVVSRLSFFMSFWSWLITSSDFPFQCLPAAAAHLHGWQGGAAEPGPLRIGGQEGSATRVSLCPQPREGPSSGIRGAHHGCPASPPSQCVPLISAFHPVETGYRIKTFTLHFIVFSLNILKELLSSKSVC